MTRRIIRVGPSMEVSPEILVELHRLCSSFHGDNNYSPCESYRPCCSFCVGNSYNLYRAVSSMLFVPLRQLLHFLLRRIVCVLYSTEVSPAVLGEPYCPCWSFLGSNSYSLHRAVLSVFFIP